MNNIAELILFTLSILPVILICIYVYKKDRDKEPPKLLIQLFLGGVLSTILVMIISSILELVFPILGANNEDLGFFELFVNVFIGVALVEEFCKWIVVYKLSYNNCEFNHIYDIIVYAVFAALGFAALENLLYVYNYGVVTGIKRFVLSVPGHACDGVFIGYYLGLAKLATVNKKDKLVKKYKILSLLIPTLLHGIYDFCLYVDKPIFICIFYIFVIILYICSIKKINQFAKIDMKFVYRDNYCSRCGQAVESDFCPKCGRKNE